MNGCAIENDWIAYFVELKHFRGTIRGRDVYLPSPAEVEWRKMDVLWLERQGFNHRFIASVMEHDMPHIERVKQMVERYGPEETYRRCLPFLERTEYDLKRRNRKVRNDNHS